MPLNIKKLFATDQSRSQAMLLGGVLSLVGASMVAGFIWQRWGELGVVIGPNGWIALSIVSLGTFVLAAATGIWALVSVNKFEGANAIKCTIGFLFDALALALLIGFLLVARSLGVSY